MILRTAHCQAELSGTGKPYKALWMTIKYRSTEKEHTTQLVCCDCPNVGFIFNTNGCHVLTPADLPIYCYSSVFRLIGDGLLSNKTEKVLPSKTHCDPLITETCLVYIKLGEM